MIWRFDLNIRYVCDGTQLAESPHSKECPMIDSDVEQYVREHEERVRKLDELFEKIRSSEYNEEEKNNFREESLKLCLEGLAAI